MDIDLLSNSAKLKRRLSYEKNGQNESKKLNLTSDETQSQNSAGLSTMEKFVIDGQLKESVMKIVTLEQNVKNLQDELKAGENKFKIEKEKVLNDLRLCQEQKYEMEQTLRKCKTNEAMIKGELEHLQSQLDKFESQPKPDKALNNLNKKINDLNEENADLKAHNDRLKFEINGIKTDFEFKVEQLKIDNTNLKNQVEKFNQIRQEYEECKKIKADFENRIRELESEVTKAKDSIKLEDIMRESDKLHELERQNRKLQSEVEYLKLLQEKAHLYKEEIESNKKQNEQLQERIKKIELENAKLQSEIKDRDSKLQLMRKNETISNYREMTNDQIKSTETRIQTLSNRVKELEEQNQQNEVAIDKLQKKLVRVNTERNGYKKIIDQYDSEMTIDPNNLLHKRIFELEEILNEYKKSFDDINELKLKNSRLYRLDDANQRSIETQVNFSEEIYKNYEKTIRDLRDKNDQLKADIRNGKENNGNQRGSDDYNDENSEANIKYRNKLIELFGKKKEEISEIIKYLTGFKIKFHDHTIKLSSTIAKTKDNFLLFKVNSDGSIKLMESEMAYKYSKYAESYLFGDPKCYAGFLGAITFDLLQIKFP